ncbi:hypothetical protein Mal4_32000 [Maioricimonas rarisocia]|uniref:Uncharacterized protein n=1 Tax=Maioricimonas rarisocia TaxID=2528026 RepID=A0A517Z8Q3_9PLAN|nr:hypothetical protein [Maioricimonas rarisocia]QDU38868.1 hypothetical protein Mal4_32000 [Maioricimonas rarisocia]
MDAVQIHCPKCGKGLRLKDRSKLGRKGKCPACGHGFLLQAPPEEEEVSLELAGDEAPVGTGAQWVPDEPAASALQASESSAVAIDTDPGPGIALDVSDGGVERLKEIKRRNARRQRTTLILGVLALLVVGGAGYALIPYLEDQPAPIPKEAEPAAPVAENTEPADVAAPSGAITRASLRSNVELVEQFEPTDGEPIRLLMVPSGANVVIHLRPAEIWSDEVAFQELRASLTADVVAWLEETLRTVCRREPKQIEEALITMMLGAIGTEPEVSTVVRLVEEEKMSDLIEEFGGQRINEGATTRIYVRDGETRVIADARTFAIAPESAASEIEEWITTSNYNVPTGIFELLDQTDRQRLATVLFEIDDVKRHEQELFSAEALPAMQHVIDWFGDDVETVSWSLHFAENFHSELFLRPRTRGAQKIVSAPVLAKTVEQKLADLPHIMQDDVIGRMSPSSRGYLRIIGRFPAMLEAFQMATVTRMGPTFVRLTTALPPQAAPNLALGALFTWDESRRTDYTAAAPPVLVAQGNGGAKLPDSVAERLRTVIVDTEFSRTPLQEAVGYLADELKVKLIINGDALKLSGYTQNMPQTFKLGKVPAVRSFHEILKQYDGKGKEADRMVIVVDEQKKQIELTTKGVADKEGKMPFDTSPE